MLMFLSFWISLWAGIITFLSIKGVLHSAFEVAAVIGFAAVLTLQFLSVIFLLKEIEKNGHWAVSVSRTRMESSLFKLKQEIAKTATNGFGSDKDEGMSHSTGSGARRKTCAAPSGKAAPSGRRSSVRRAKSTSKATARKDVTRRPG